MKTSWKTETAKMYEQEVIKSDRQQNGPGNGEYLCCLEPIALNELAAGTEE